MSQFGQRGGGVNIFQKCLKFKMSQRSEGGGSTLIGTLSQIFSIFYFDGSPKMIIWVFTFYWKGNNLQ